MALNFFYYLCSFLYFSGLMILRPIPHTGTGPPAFRSCSEPRFPVWFDKFDGISSVWLVTTLSTWLHGSVVPWHTILPEHVFRNSCTHAHSSLSLYLWVTFTSTRIRGWNSDWDRWATIAKDHIGLHSC